MEATVLEQHLHETELQVIGAVVHDPSTRSAAFRELTPDSLHAEEHIELWTKLQALYADSPDFTHGEFRLQGIKPALAKAVADLGPATHYRALSRFRTARAMIALQRAALEAVQGLDSLAVEPGAVNRWLRSLQDAQQRAAEGMDAPEAPPTVQDEAEAFAESVVADVESAKATWGLEELDRRCGGLQPGTLHIPLAETGNGKTMLALTAARATADRGERVLIVPLEQGTRELAIRLCAASLGSKPFQMRKDLQDKRRQPSQFRGLISSKIVVEDQAETVAQIAAIVNEARIAGDPFTLVIVDYLQLLDTMGLREVEGFGENARQLKLLARKQGCAVICPSQPRSLETPGAMPETRHLYGSRMIGNHSDSVVAMRVLREAGFDERGGMVDVNGSSCVAHTAELQVCKARAGEVGKLGDVYWGRGTFILWDSKNAPWSHTKAATAERNVRETGSHREGVTFDDDELERMSQVG